MFAAVPVHTLDRENWLETRREGLGGSDIAAVVGLSPWSTPFSVYVDKIGAVPLDDEGSEAMRWGQVLEGAILTEWEERSGLWVVHQGSLFRNLAEPWMLCTVDGLAGESPYPDLTGVIAVAEVKSTGEWSWDEVPAHYQCQAQWEMAVTGLDRTIFVVLHMGKKLATYEVKADPDDQAALIEAGRAFWFDRVLAEQPPPMEARDSRLLSEMWPEDSGDEVPVDGVLVQALAEVRAELRPLEERRADLENRIKASMGEAAFGTVNGERVVSWKTQTSRRVDTTRLKAERPDVAAEYTTESTSRVFRLSKEMGT